MKKMLLMSSAVYLAALTPASARVDVGLYIGEPAYVEPTYVAEPAPNYVVAPSYPAYYHHRHYHHEPPHDWHHHYDHDHDHDDHDWHH